MLDRRYQTDLRYLQSHPAEIEREIEAERRQGRSLPEPGLKDRLYNSAGDLLIAWGQKLKRETVYDELCQDCG